MVQNICLTSKAPYKGVRSFCSEGVKLIHQRDICAKRLRAIAARI